ncbi:MAG: hypothetical protein HY074_17545 [Deltaproteobacteria bacterium]|nr:hypothetical protein [Deltaproteobacteria bacterium]
MGLMRLFASLLALLALLTVFSCTRTPEFTMPKGKVLHVVLEDNVKGLDPVSTYDIIGGEILLQTYEVPYQYDYFSETPHVIPMLADGMPQLSKDALTYTLKIKKGIRFQDDPCFKETSGKGRELKAADFIYSWKRQANVANEAQGFWIFDGKIVGINDFQKKFGQGKPAEEVMKENVEGFKTLDDHTIQIKLTKPYPQLTYALATSFGAPVPEEAVRFYGKDFERHPVGTGPFKVQSYDAGFKVVVVKNENFRDEFFPTADQMAPKYREAAKAYAGKRLPLVDAIEFNVIKEEQPRWLGFLAGKYDEVKIPKDNFNSAIEHKTRVKAELANKGISVSIEPALSYWYVSINMQDKLLGQNKYLRQAIASAIDRDAWLEMFKNGRGSSQNEVNPPILKERCGKPYRWNRDVKRAKELLAKAGYPDGKGLPVIKWDTRRTEMSERQLAELIEKNLAEIGVHLEIINNTFPAYLDKSHKGNLQLSKGGFVMDYPDPENNFQMLFGPNKAPGPNEANFDNAEFNKLYEQTAVMAPSAERTRLICKMEDVLQDEVPWAYGIFEDEYRLVHKWLKNYHTSELIYTKYKYVDLDLGDQQLTASRSR